MHFSSPYTTMEDWSRHKAQSTDNVFPSSLALPGQPLQQSTTSIQTGVSGAPRNSNTFLDGPFHDFMPYQLQQFDDLLQQPNRSPSQPSPQIQQQHQQPSWIDQRYTQTYIPMTTNSISMGQPAYYNQHQPPTSHQIQHHMQQQSQHHQSMSSPQHMSYPQQNQVLPHQQQAFLGSLNLSHRHHQYAGLPTHESSQHGMQQLPHGMQQLHQSSPQQPGRKRKEVNNYLEDNAMAIPIKKPKKKKKKVKEPEDPNAPPKPKRKTGLNKPLILSAPLSALMDDEAELSRPEIVKRLWKYIKGNNLQDPKDRRFILCDDKLKTIFHVDRVNSFGMNRDLSLHLTKKEVTEEQPSSTFSTESCTTTSSATDDTTTATNTTASIKESPTVTAETPDDVVTPQEGEHVQALTKGSNPSLATPGNHITSNSTITSSTPLLHSLLL